MARMSLEKLQTTANIIPMTVFHQLPYWKILDPDDQKKVVHVSQEIARALVLEGASKLAQGKYFFELQEILKNPPYRCYVEHVQTLYRKISVKTSYRRIAEYQNAVEKYTEPVLKALLARGLDAIGESKDRPFGKYTEIIKENPPPRTEDPYKIDEWMDRVETGLRKRRSDLRMQARMRISFSSAHPNVETTVIRAFRHARSQIRRLPEPIRPKAVQKLFEYILDEFKIPGFRVNPERAPEEYRRGPGKPRLKKAIQ